MTTGLSTATEKHPPPPKSLTVNSTTVMEMWCKTWKTNIPKQNIPKTKYTKTEYYNAYEELLGSYSTDHHLKSDH